MLGDLVFDAIADRAVVGRLAAAIGAESALARLQAGRKEVARGDFGEVFAAACMEEFEGLAVPVRKLRFKIDPEQTQPGTDLVAFRVMDGEITAVEFVETKLRTVRALAAAEQAHTQLRDDNDAGFGDILEFVAERLAETNPAMFEAFLAHLAARSDDDGNLGQFGIFLVWDEGAWDEGVIDRLDGVSRLVDPLHVRVAILPNLAALVDDAYALVGLEAVDVGS